MAILISNRLFSKRLFAIVLLTVMSGSLVFACRTAKPKDEALDPSSITAKGESEDSLQLDVDPNGSARSLWSPEQRRANASFQYLVGMKTLYQGDIKGALPILESSYNLDPNAYTGSQLVEVKLLAGEINEAETEAHRMTLLYPKDEKLRMKYGQILIFKGDLKGAEIQLKKAIDLNPKFEDSYVLLARVFTTQKQQKEALALIQKMMKVLPGSLKGLSIQVRLEIAAKNFKAALKPAAQLWSLQQGQPEAALLYGLTLDLNGKPKEAVQLYEQILRLNVANPELVQRMVSLYQEMGNLEDALGIIDDMMARTNQRHPALVMQKAIILSELRRDEEASVTLEELLKEHPESDRVQFMSGLALEKTGKTLQAFDRYKEIPEDSPVKLPSEYRRAFILKQQNKVEDALELLKRITARKDADATTWQVRIEFLGDLKKYDEARDVSTEAFKLYPDKAPLLFLKGVYEERTGRLGDAERSMRALIKLEPNHAPALNFLGYMLAEQNRELDEAERLILKALSLKPGDGSYLDSLGWVFYQRKEYAKALETLKKALDASPKEGVIMEHIADVLIKNGDFQGAYSYLDQALKTDLEDRDRVRIETKLKDTRQKMK